ncbi:MAG: single-stranded-DNA-specific exonuclease RecJ [Sulfurospirillum sp.]|nr:single-stranded-DNA-specific exonuclease RecJ [Sulfurospirillum sp.]
MDKLLTKEDVRKILTSRFCDDLCCNLSDMPKPNSFKDIEKASLRIANAIKNKERIAIVGDYDVDGVVSSVILSTFFDDLGVAYTLHIPNRFSDGYGLNVAVVQKLDVDVIITVDNGISAVDAAMYCKEKGIDLIITDHHTLPTQIPQAFAIVNPKQPDCDFPNCEICGAQVAWYLVAALKSQLKISYDLAQFLDLLAIAIMADMMELKDMNRVMVKRGIAALNTSHRPIFEAIKQYYAKSTLEGDDISYLIAPLINSSGRMEDATLSFELLKSATKQEAYERLEYIVELNNSRKDEEKILFDCSSKQMDASDAIIVVWGEDWHEGVVGIVASRLSKKYKKPAIVFSLKEGRAKGSARGIGSVDILSLISEQKDILLGFGGHKGAAGVSLLVENLKKFKTDILESAKKITQKELESGASTLGQIPMSEIDFELLEILEEFEPYGQKNPKPSFILRDALVKIDRVIGRDRNHLKLVLQQNNHCVESLFFNYDVNVKRGNRIDILFNVSRNNYRGLVTPQLLIKQVLDCR